MCGCAWPLCKFFRSEEHPRTVLLAQAWYRGCLYRCAFFLYPGYFIIALPVLPPCVLFYKPTGLIQNFFSSRYRPPTVPTLSECVYGVPPCATLSTLITLHNRHHPATWCPRLATMLSSMPSPFVAVVKVGKGDTR